jgi:hypothetical protein
VRAAAAIGRDGGGGRDDGGGDIDRGGGDIDRGGGTPRWDGGGTLTGVAAGPWGGTDRLGVGGGKERGGEPEVDARGRGGGSEVPATDGRLVVRGGKGGIDRATSSP